MTNNGKKIYLGLVALFFFPSMLVGGQKDVDLLAILSVETIKDLHYLPDYSFAGYGNGLLALPKTSGTVVAVDDFGASGNDEIDDTKAILAAIAHANKVDGPVIVRFSPGRYRVSEVLRIERSDFVLQGAGSGPNDAAFSSSAKSS